MEGSSAVRDLGEGAVVPVGPPRRTGTAEDLRTAAIVHNNGAGNSAGRDGAIGTTAEAPMLPAGAGPGGRRLPPLDRPCVGFDLNEIFAGIEQVSRSESVGESVGRSSIPTCSLSEMEMSIERLQRDWFSPFLSHVHDPICSGR
eukprot:GHVU01212150.1.p2 GENE.GHVU01212150.1~~GHVU01212150.1.p2  ORF type:complete len:144 (-),score=2.05 GHVU01212150.1:244-675(-)